jgi:hypothetical protein
MGLPNALPHLRTWPVAQDVFGLVDILDIVTYDVLVHLPLEFLFFRTGCVVGSRCAFGHLHDRASNTAGSIRARIPPCNTMAHHWQQ